MSWRQSLKPFAAVPAWAKDLGVFLSATYISIDGPGKDSFTDFAPKLVNWGVSYTNRKVLVKVNVNQTAPLRNGELATEPEVNN